MDGRVGEAKAGWPEELRERYEVLEILGEGGMGLVLKARDRRLDRFVAVKTVRGGVFGTDPAYHARLRREIEILLELRHPQVVTLLDAHEWDDGEILVMELIEGWPLPIPVPADWTPPRVFECMGDVAEGLAFAHERGVIHRDLKPDNLFIDRWGNTRILDLGLGTFGSAEGRPTLTQAGKVMGTLKWLSPEAWKGEGVGPAADVFQLALVAQAALTGRLHSEGRSVEALMYGKVYEELARGEFLPSGLAPSVRKLLLESLSVDPKDRPSARAFADTMHRNGGSRAMVAPRGPGRKREDEPGDPPPPPRPRPDDAPEGSPRPSNAKGTTARRFRHALLALLLLIGAFTALVLPRGRAPQVEDLHVEAHCDGFDLRWKSSEPQRLAWQLFMEDCDGPVARGRESRARMDHDQTFRGYPAGKSYRLRLLHGGRTEEIALATKAAFWALRPRLSVFQGSVSLRWHGRGIDGVRWRLQQKGLAPTEGRGEAEGQLHHAYKAPISEQFPLTWSIEAPGLEGVAGRSTGSSFSRPLAGNEGPPSEASGKIPSPVFCQDTVVWTDGEGDLNAIAVNRSFGEGKELAPDWSSREHGELVRGGGRFGQVVVSEHGRSLQAFRHGSEKGRSGLHRFTRRPGVKGASFGPTAFLPWPKADGERPLASFLHGRAFLHCSARGSEGTVIMRAFDVEAQKLLWERSFGATLFSDPAPFSNRRGDETPFFDAGQAAIPLRPLLFDEAWWLALFLGSRPGERHDWAILRILPDGGTARVNVVASVMSPSPILGPSLVQGELWITAGPLLLRKRRGRPLECQSLFPPSSGEGSALVNCDFLGRVYDDRGTPSVFCLDRMPEDESLSIFDLEQMHALSLRRLRIDGRPSSWRLLGTTLSRQSYLAHAFVPQGCFIQEGNVVLASFPRGFAFTRGGALKLFPSFFFVNGIFAMTTTKDQELLAFTDSRCAVHVCDLSLLDAAESLEELPCTMSCNPLPSASN